jgi:O-antigen/teichoic acid export membrane protein
MALHTFVWLYFYNLLPTLSRNAGQPFAKTQRLVSQSLAMTCWAGILIGLVPTLMGEALIAIAFGSQYIGAAVPLAILAWVIPVTLLSGHYRYLLIAHSRQRLECLCTAISSVAAVALGLALIPSFGAVGAAAALLTANLVNLGVAYAFARRELGSIPFMGHVALPLLAAAGAFAVFLALSGQGVWLAGGGAAVAYLIALGGWAYRSFHLKVGRASPAAKVLSPVEIAGTPGPTPA